MSYDLAFLSRGEPPRISQLFDYFDGRANYRRESNSVVYGNEDTGVYFVFDIGDPATTSDDAPSVDDGLAPAPLAFNLNYYRGPFFGLEAELELAAVVAEFGLLVDDPQVDGMGRGAYSREGFLRGWNAGNRFAHSALMRNDSGAVDVLPTAELERLWRWNFDRHRLQHQYGEGLFVPVVMLFRVDGRLRTAAVWTDAIPEALPRVDLILLVRQELARKRLFRRSKPEMCLVPFGDVEALGVGDPHVSDHLLLDYDAAPSHVVEFFRAQPVLAESAARIDWDAVLSEELVAEASATSGAPDRSR